MQTQPTESHVLMDCCRVADRLPLDVLAREWGRKPPARGSALTLEGAALAAALRRESAPGAAYLFSSGCLVTAGMEPRDTQALLLLLVRNAPDADLERLLMMREVRTAPAEAADAQARALAASVMLDALEHRADQLLSQAKSSQPRRQKRLPLGRRHARQLLGQATAFRYQCAHGYGALDRPDAGWNLQRRAAYKRLADELRLSARAKVLLHKLDGLEEILLRAGELGHTGGSMRQLWLEAWMLLLFPLLRVVELVAVRYNGFAWLQRWLHSLRLFG